MTLLEERRARIQEGLAKADEADRRLSEVTEIAKGKLHHAENEILALLKQAEKKSKEYEAKLLAKVREKEEIALKEVEQLIHAKEHDAEVQFEKERVALIKTAIEKVISMAPETFDTALINQALSHLHE